jgi:AcrR family transcriptional regulator
MDYDSSLRDRIIRHAGLRFFEQGFSRITTEELARQLGISKKTLYRVFGSKEELVRAVVRRKLNEVDDQLSGIFDDESRSFLERFGAQMEVAGNIMNSLSKPFLSDLGKYLPDLWEEIQQFRKERVLSRMEGIIRSGQREGMIRADANPKILVKIIITIADTLLVPGTLAESDMNPHEVIRHMGIMISEGVLTERGRSGIEAADFINNGEEVSDEKP